MIPPTASSAIPRRSGALMMVSIVVMLAGCAPTPEPTPTPTAAFASEEEAFAAAEETFQHYADATNETDLTDPSSFEPVFAWLAGDALSAARENYSQFYAAGITRSGASTFDAFTPMEYSDGTVTALVCLDISEVTLSNADGTSAVPPDRPPRQAIEVFYVSAETATRLAISSTTPTESIQCE
ncbi:hypothetical protein [Microbacterium sp. DWRC1-3]|uniref:hypothetical protein n=1 Tax=Microbacterium sp. DWRC1-3 TaxID=2804630 RepID=UPI003CED0674